MKKLLFAGCGIVLAWGACGSAYAKDAVEIAGDPAPATGWAKRLQRAPVGDTAIKEIFSGTSWAPPAPAPAAPSVPPFPFNYMGKMIQEGKPPVVFLTKGADVFTVAAGDILEGTYRIEEIGADNLVLTYLPLKKKEILAYSNLVAPPLPLLPGLAAAEPASGMVPPVAAAGPSYSAQGVSASAGAQQAAPFAVAAGFAQQVAQAAAAPVQQSATVQAASNSLGGAMGDLRPSNPMPIGPPGPPMQILPPGKPMQAYPPIPQADSTAPSAPRSRAFR